MVRGVLILSRTVMLTVKCKPNWQTSLPRAIGSPTDSQTVLLPTVG